MQKQKRKETTSPMLDETITVTKKKNNSRSALETLESSNTSCLSSDASMGTKGGTPKKNERRYMVACEMLDTEENYLKILNILIEIFKNPLEKMVRSGETRDLLNMKELQILFKKIQPIVHVHSYICQNLRKNISDWRNTNLIGKIWMDSTADLERVYPPYINSYDDILKTLDFCESTKPRFYAFVKQAESRPECMKNSVRDLLIRPIQRIPSVLLLLQELFKRTDRSNPDYPFLEGAVDLLKGVLEKTNESRRRTENFQHFMEICQEIEDLPPDVVHSDREFIQNIDVVVISAGGALQKYKGKKIGLFLFNDFVEMAKSRFCTSELSTSMNTSLNASFNSGTSGSSGTLTRQMSLSGLRRGASWKKERRQYKHIELYRFASFRSVEFEPEHGVFIVKIRDQKADELCFFQPTNGYTFDIGIDFFENLILRIKTNSTREIKLEEVSVSGIRNQLENRPEEAEVILKAISIAAELNATGTIRRRHSLRRSVSSLAIGTLGLGRIGSFKRQQLANIRE